MSPTHTYKMRAESFTDVARVVYEIAMYPCTITLLSDCTTDAEITFDSNLSLQALRIALRKLPDCHVMAETVALAQDYTGERGVPDCARCGVERYVEHDPYGNGLCDPCEDETSEDVP